MEWEWAERCITVYYRDACERVRQRYLYSYVHIRAKIERNWGRKKYEYVCTRKRQKKCGEWTRKKKSRAIVSMAIGRSVFRSKRKWGGGAGGLAEGARGSNIVRYFGRRRLNIWRIISALVIHLLPFHLVQVYIPSLSATYACWLH